MKIVSLKFGLTLGMAMSLLFLICNNIFAIGGKEISLIMVNTLFHEMIFKPLITDSGFNIGKLVIGLVILFLEGLFTGFFTAFIFNSLHKSK